MRNEIICAGLILLETILCGSGESPLPLSSRETDDGYNLHERLGGGMKERRRKRETGTGGNESGGGDGGGGDAAATAGKGTLITSR